MHLAGLELAKLTYCTRLEDNLTRHPVDRLGVYTYVAPCFSDVLHPKADFESSHGEGRAFSEPNVFPLPKLPVCITILKVFWV